jgi:hypothetical protein
VSGLVYVIGPAKSGLFLLPERENKKVYQKSTPFSGSVLCLYVFQNRSEAEGASYASV